MTDLIWTTEKRKINDLIPYEKNPRQMTEKQVEDLKKSLEKFGLVEIPAIDTDNKIIAGHQRLKIMQLLNRGEEEIDVRIPNRKLTEEEFKEYNVRSNLNTAEWDWELLVNNFELDLMIEFGFDEGELYTQLDLLKNTKEDDFDADAEAEKITEPTSKLGDLFQLGEHRLLCGDATKKDDVGRLMDRQKADMVFTDPPYNMDKGFENDKLSWEDYLAFVDKSLLQMSESCIDNCAIYWFGSFISLAKCLEIFSKYFIMKREIVWIKAACQGTDRFPQSCEYLFYGEKGDPSFNQDSIRTNWREYNFEKGLQSDMYENIETKGADSRFNKPHDPRCRAAQKVVDYGIIPKNYWFIKNRQGGYLFGKSDKLLHVNEKPIELLSRGILASSIEKNIVLDVFGGSGSTLIACEQLKRKCYMMEIDPKYIDVIIKRWEQYTNKKAVKL
jgi:DNA modification methylase